jgi:uncharacterized protein with NRDE domain
LRENAFGIWYDPSLTKENHSILSSKNKLNLPPVTPEFDMCLIFISFQHHPRYKLVVAGNRDEFYNRRTAGADYWADYPQILGGRDLEAGGTWLGMSTSGKISMLTNYRDLKNIKPAAPSRGQLVSDFLKSDITPETYTQQIEREGKKYNGFNLIVGNPEQLWYYSNYRDGVTKLSPGFYGISNHLLESPWPKVLIGKEKIAPALQKNDVDPEQLLDILYDDKIAADDKLPDTGLPLERERALSSMFIKTSNYGSRCSTVVLVDRSDNVFFSERVYDLETFSYKTNTFRYSIK